MSIQVLWDNDEQTVARYYFEGDWTWNEVKAAVDQVAVMMDTVGHRVDLIVDLTRSGPLPTLSPSVLSYIATAPTVKHPNSGRFVIVGKSLYLSRSC